MSNEPMTGERLAEIAARMANIREIQAVGPDDFADMEPWQLQAIVQGYAEDVPNLLAEVERQRAENAEQQMELARLIHELDAANDEIAFQRDINQQLGQENEQQQSEIAIMHPCTRCGDCYRIPAERAEGYMCPICRAELSGMDPLVTSGTRRFRHWLQAGGKGSFSQFEQVREEE